MTASKDVERLLKDISELRNDYIISCDIYHDDLKDNFVVKLHGFGHGLNSQEHFRGQSISGLLEEAIAYIEILKTERDESRTDIPPIKDGDDFSDVPLIRE